MQLLILFLYSVNLPLQRSSTSGHLGFGWSVAGAALATVVAVYTQLALSLHVLISAGTLKPKDLLSVPNPMDFLPILREGLQLSLRTVLFMVMMASGSMLIAQRGAIIHSTFELCRQTTLLTFVSYLALEQTVQSLAASYLGLKDYKRAREIVVRVIQVRFFNLELCSVLCRWHLE